MKEWIEHAAPRVGWIGLGKMGLPICRRIQAAGGPLWVYDIQDASRNAMAEAGAHVASDVMDLAASVEVVMTMLPDDDAFREVVLGDQGVLARLSPGSVLMDLSTVSPQVSEQVSAAAAVAGVDYLCAPVSGSTALAEAGTLTLFTSGSQDVHERLREVMSLFSAQQYYTGDAHQARYLKLAINHLVGSTAVLMGEALALGRAGGLDWSLMLEVIGASVVASPLVHYKLDMLRERDFSPAFSAAQMIKDMSLVSASGRRSGTYMPVADLVAERFRDCPLEMAEKDFFAIVEDVERRSSGLTHESPEETP